VLSPDENGKQFKMSSPMIDALIRTSVIPSIYRLTPPSEVPTIKKDNNWSLNFLEILKEAVKIFDKELMIRAAECAFKFSRVKVDGAYSKKVPRESVYDSELMRILSNWLKQGQYNVTGQWHHVIGKTHKYSDINVTGERSKCVLEPLATGHPDFVKEHIERTKQYKDNLGAEEAWVVHFTREDDYLADPMWQSEELLIDDINVIHFWHNLEFTNVRMSAKVKGRGMFSERII
jgi:hypothetical protein